MNNVHTPGKVRTIDISAPDGVVHYKELFAWWARIQAIPEEDRQIILNKPAVHERAADGVWRRRCEKYDIDTGAVGIADDKKKYFAERNLEQRIKTLEAELAAKDERLSKTGLQSAIYRMAMNVERPSAMTEMQKELKQINEQLNSWQEAIEWLLARVCKKCLHEIIRALKSGPNSEPMKLCAPCREHLLTIAELSMKARIPADR